jgi:hypothetical protein
METMPFIKTEALFVMCVLTLPGAVFAQKPDTDSASEPPESSQHRYARLKYEAAETKSAPIMQRAERLAAIHVCLEEGKKCQLDDGTVQAGVREYCPRMQQGLAQHSNEAPERKVLIQRLLIAECRLVLSKSAQAMVEEADALNVPNLKQQMDHADECAALYRSTIDKKVSDMTTRKTDNVKACKAMDLYPPQGTLE